MKISSVSIAQSRQTSFQLEASELDSHIQNMRFQSPNRVKPLSNQEKIDEVTRRFRVSIAQSRQTSFQHANNAHAAILDKGAVSIAQSRQTSFQLRLIAYIKQRIDVVSIAQSRQTSFQRYVRNRPDFDNDVSIAQSRQTSFQQGYLDRFIAPMAYRFNRPIASNLFPTADLVRRVLEPLEGTFCERVALKSIITHGVENRQPLNEPPERGQRCERLRSKVLQLRLSQNDGT